MGKYLDMLENANKQKILESRTHGPDQTDQSATKGLSSVPSGSKLAISPKKMAERLLSNSIQGLPVTLAEVVQLYPLDGPNSHTEVFTDGSFTPELIRLHIASWLLFNKRCPYPIHYDAENLLRQRGKIQ